MFRKVLQRSFPILVAAFVLIGVLIGVTALPARAAYFVPSEDNPNLDVASFEAFLKFDVQATFGEGDCMGFSMPSTVTDMNDATRTEIRYFPEAGFQENYKAQLNYYEASHPYLMEEVGLNAYYKVNLGFSYNETISTAPGEAVYPTYLTYTFDDFLLALPDVKWGSSQFLFHVPEGVRYTLSYDYYYVQCVPSYFGNEDLIRVISEKQTQSVTDTATVDLDRAFVRESDYDLMVEAGTSLDTYVLFTNPKITLFYPTNTAVGGMYFYYGFSRSGDHYPLSWFYTENDLDLGEVVFVDREVPVFDVSITEFLTSGVSGFLDANIFGTFSIGDMLSILVTIFFVIFVLKIIS